MREWHIGRETVLVIDSMLYIATERERETHRQKGKQQRHKQTENMHLLGLNEERNDLHRNEHFFVDSQSPVNV